MPRFIRQPLFDALVIERLMSELAGNDDAFNRLLDQYHHSYPDEDPSTLLADVSAAATQGRDILAEIPAASARDEMTRLEQMLEIFNQGVAGDKPLWRRMVETFFFNIQSKPIPDRVQSAREHLLAARDRILARSTGLSVP